jgi:2-C-methyl-D-erythritol 2,4-cyclodiphosphate synthase
MTRVGWGFDAHRIGGEGPMRLGGVVVAGDRGLVGTSDADVALHAIADAILGAAALGDLGTHFPPDDPRWAGADSASLLGRVVALATDAGFTIGSLDLTIVAQSVRIAPVRAEMRERIAAIVGIPVTRVSVKATSTDGMGFLGRDEGIASIAVAVLN